MSVRQQLVAATATMAAVLCRIAMADAVRDAGIDIEPFAVSALEARIPADLPRRGDVLERSRKCRCFLASGKVEFRIAAHWPDSIASEDSVKIEAKVENLFGEPPARAESTLDKTASRLLDGGMREREMLFALDENPGCGLWRLRVTVSAAGTGLMQEATALFEVFADEDAGASPPLESKLPVLVSVPHADAVDGEAIGGFNPYGGGQTFSVCAATPSAAAKLRLWDAASPFRRTFFCCTGGDTDLHDESTVESLQHASVFQGDDFAGNCGFFDFTRPDRYRGAQLCILRDYLAEKRPGLSKLTLADVNLRIGRDGSLSRDEFDELFATCWQDFLAFANESRRKMSTKFADSLRKANPKLARGDFQPVSFDRSRSPYVLAAASRVPEDDSTVRARGSFFMLADSSGGEESFSSIRRKSWRMAYFAAGYSLAFGDSRMLYPQLDVARNPVAAAYRFAMGTPFLKAGEYGYWSDNGFHVQASTGDDSLADFCAAWGDTLRNKPYHPCKSPFVVVDFDAFARVGDTICFGAANGAPQVDNAAEFSVGRVYEQCVAAGYAPPVVLRLSDIASLTAEMAEFVVLPPIVKGTPQSSLDVIRDANARGIPMLALNEAAGLEDLFGVRQFPDGAKKISSEVVAGAGWTAPDLPARYRSDGAVVLANASAPSAAAKDVPVAFYKKASGRAGALALASAPLDDSSMQAVLSRLAPRPAVKTEKGTVVASVYEDGSACVVVFADTQDFHGLNGGSVSFCFSVSALGIARSSISTKVPHVVESREPDRITIRVDAAADAVLPFRFEKTSL